MTGRGLFVAGARRDGMLHAAFVRSYLAHGEIRQVDVTAARAAPGVVAAFTAADLTLRDIPATGGLGPDVEGMPRPPIAAGRVRYVGEAVAVVVGTSRASVADAVELVDVDLDPMAVVADVPAALRDDTLLHPATGSNVALRQHRPEGTTPPDLNAWPIVVDVEVDNQRLAPVPIEPLGMLAESGPDGTLVIHCGHQAPHRLRRQLASLLDLDEDGIRVVVPDTGGGFGLRGMLFPEYVVVAAVARRLARPVTWTETRTEQFQGGTHGRAMIHRVRLAGDEDGRVRAAHVQITTDLGAYPHNGAHLPGLAAFMAPGPYDIGEVHVESTMVVTNRAPVGSYRGAGRPEATYAIERAIEAFGRAARLDAVEVRRRNLVPATALPYRTALGASYDSGDYPAALDLVLELVGTDAVRADQARRRRLGGPQLGLGVAMFVERAGGAADSTEYARVEVGDDGRVTVRAGTAATGQGHETVWARLAAAPLGIDEDDVDVIAGDTGRVREGVGSFGSRSAQIGGSAIVRCARRVREQLLDLAAEMLEVDPEDLVLAAGAVAVDGAPSRSVSQVDLAAAASARGRELASEESYSPHAQTFPYGATAAIVEVDVETGLVRLERLVAVDDCGTVIDPVIVEGQVHGSLVQGISQALFEEVVYDADGQLLTSTLIDYPVPAAPDLPDLETGRLTHPAPSNPLGAKGTGESGCLGAPPAIVHAVLDALAPYGVSDLDMPVTPERVWRALAAATATRPPAAAHSREPGT